jgi:transcriptional regulator with XRE-family HTH domain
MERHDSFAEFGRALRALRAKRGLTLSQVASLTKSMARDSAGRISQPYLSQLELGKAKGITAAKIGTLARIYGVPSDELVHMAPLDLQVAFSFESCSDVRVDERVAPAVSHQIDEQIEDALAMIDNSATIPLSSRKSAMREIRNAVLSTALCAFAERDTKSSGDFWRSLDLDPIGALDSSGIGWRGIAEQYRDWVLYESLRWREVVSSISFWTFTFVNPQMERAIGGLVACRLRPEALDIRYGHQLVPDVVLRAVRWRQLANLLFASRPAGVGKLLKPPPRASEAAFDAIAHLSESVLFDTLPTKGVTSTIEALLQHLPRPGRDRLPQDLWPSDAINRLLNGEPARRR